MTGLYSLDDLKELKKIGYEEYKGNRFNLGCSLDWNTEIFYKKRLSNREATLYVTKNVFGIYAEILFFIDGQPFKSWRRWVQKEDLLVEETLRLLYGTIENYFDGVHGNYNKKIRPKQ